MRAATSFSLAASPPLLAWRSGLRPFVLQHRKRYGYMCTYTCQCPITKYPRSWFPFFPVSDDAQACDLASQPWHFLPLPMIFSSSSGGPDLALRAQAAFAAHACARAHPSHLRQLPVSRNSAWQAAEREPRRGRERGQRREGGLSYSQGSGRASFESKAWEGCFSASGQASSHDTWAGK